MLCFSHQHGPRGDSMTCVPCIPGSNALMGTEDSDAQNPRAAQRRNFGAFRMVTKDGFPEKRHSAEPERVTRADQVKEEMDRCSRK